MYIVYIVITIFGLWNNLEIYKPYKNGLITNREIIFREISNREI